MILESIRAFNHAAPFRPYAIRTASGETHRVPHPDFVFISPRGSYVIVIDARERPHHLSTLLIEEAVLLNGRARRKAGKKTA
ncbi:MAG: hypothetical protein HY736_05795 [Verrucomicrobia bacterium]|nr:hypothetical protein [Verrucomicrobiota bacterium]